jgi:prepilin-type N-terminal cleavage/methylation domain-containing protein
MHLFLSGSRKQAVRKAGFTLVELLASLAIVGVLAALLIGAVGKVQASARNAGCLNVLRQYGTAFHLYAGENKDIFPQGSSSNPKWFSSLAPYMGAQTSAAQSKVGTCPELFARFSEYESYFNENTAKEDRRGYQFNRYLNRGVADVAPIPRKAIAHPSRTVLLWESVGVGSDSGNISGYPGGSYYYPKYRHGGKMNLLMVSGEVTTRTGINDPNEAVTDTSIPAAEGGINWKKSGEPFYFQ